MSDKTALKIENVPSWQKNPIDWIATNINYFITAVKLDVEDLNSGVSVPDPWANLKNWSKTFGLPTVILVFSMYFVSRMIVPARKTTKRSHHGINKYGIRY